MGALRGKPVANWSYEPLRSPDAARAEPRPASPSPIASVPGLDIPPALLAPDSVTLGRKTLRVFTLTSSRAARLESDPRPGPVLRADAGSDPVGHPDASPPAGVNRRLDPGDRADPLRRRTVVSVF